MSKPITYVINRTNVEKWLNNTITLALDTPTQSGNGSATLEFGGNQYAAKMNQWVCHFTDKDGIKTEWTFEEITKAEASQFNGQYDNGKFNSYKTFIEFTIVEEADDGIKAPPPGSGTGGNSGS